MVLIHGHHRKMIPVFASAVDVIKENNLTFASKGQKPNLQWKKQFTVAISSGQRERQWHSFTCWEFSQHRERKQYRTCPDPQQNLTINKKKLQLLMHSEQETGGQRKELPLVRFYGFTNDRFWDLGKKKQTKKKTKQSVKSLLKSHAKYWMPQACIYLVLRSTAR